MRWDKRDIALKIRSKTIKEIHQALSKPLINRLNVIEKVDAADYSLHFSCRHALRSGDHELALKGLQNIPLTLKRLKLNRHYEWVQDFLETRELPRVLIEKSNFKLWQKIVLSLGHLFNQADKFWPADRIFEQIIHTYQNFAVFRRQLLKIQFEADESRRYWNEITGDIELFDRCLRTYLGHQGRVKNVYKIDDHHMLSWANDNTIRRWNIEKASCDKIIYTSPFGLTVCKISPENFIVGGLENGELRVWDVDTFDCLKIVNGHAGEVLDIAFIGPNKLISWSSDNSVKVWRYPELELLNFDFNRTASIKDARLLDDGNLVSWGEEGLLSVWSGPNFNLKFETKAHEDEINGVIFLNDNKFLSYSEDKLLKVWDLKDGRLLSTFNGHEGSVYSALQLSNSQIISSSGDATLRLWNVSGENKAIMSGHEYSVWEAIQLENQNIISRSALQGGVKIWDENGILLFTLNGHSEGSAINGLMDMGKGRALSWSTDGSLRLFDSTDGSEKYILRGHVDPVEGILEIGPELLVSWSYDGALKLWDLSLKDIQSKTSHKHSDQVRQIERLNEQLLVSSSWDGSVKIWSSYNGEVLHTLKAGFGPVHDFVIADNSYVVAATWDSFVDVWNPLSGKLVARLDCLNQSADLLKILNKNKVLAVSSERLIVWDLEKESILYKIDAHHEQISEICLLEHSVISCSEDGTIKAWDLLNGELITEYKGHTDAVWGLKEVDSDRFLSWSEDGTIRIWDKEAGDCLAVIVDHEAPIVGVNLDFSANLLSWGEDSSIRVWSLLDYRQKEIIPELSAEIDMAFQVSAKEILAKNENGYFRFTKVNGSFLEEAIPTLEMWKNYPYLASKFEPGSVSGKKIAWAVENAAYLALFEDTDTNVSIINKRWISDGKIEFKTYTSNGDPVYASGSEVVILRECLIKKKEDTVQNFNFVPIS